MNWLRNLLRKPPAKLAAAPAPQRASSPAAPPPPADPERLRRVLAASLDEDARQRTAADLGKALAGLGQAPTPANPPEVWVAAAAAATDKAAALQWATGVDGDPWLGEVAMRESPDDALRCGQSGSRPRRSRCSSIAGDSA